MRAVDLFAGWGGFTTGASLVPGVRVVWAANHSPLCVAVHELNHPHVAHACQDLQQADWTSLPRFDLLLASPACQGHSSASQPRRRTYHDAMRQTAYAVLTCADITRPRAIIVENVLSFREWDLYDHWIDGFRALGYFVQPHVVDATACDVPQRRRRLIVTMTRRPLPFMLTTPPGPEPAFGPHVQWDAGDFRPWSEASADARARFARGRKRCGRRFLSQHVTNHPGVPLHEAVRTITTKDQWVVVDGDTYRPFTLREYARAMSFADDYRWPNDLARTDVVQGLGNAIPPFMARDVVAAVAGAVA